MSIEMQRPVSQKTPVSSGSAITFLVLASAMLIGSTGGILIADRQASVGRKVTAAAKSTGLSTSQPSKDGSALSKPEGLAPEGSKEKTSAEKPSPEAQKSVPLSIGTIHYSEKPDSASVAVELGPTVLVGTDKAHDPERIYFDLRDSHRPEGPVDGFRATKAVRTNGTLVGRVLVSEWESGAIRIVLDLKLPCDYTYEITSGPSPRLVVRVQPRTPGEIVSD
jgi:hypothetical protein